MPVFQGEKWQTALRLPHKLAILVGLPYPAAYETFC
jgi:hypothetical protein